MDIKEFMNLIDQTAKDVGFENEFLIMIADKNGNLRQWTHVYNDRIKRCKVIDKIVRLLKRSGVFKEIY